MNGNNILTERDREVLTELEALVRETYQLWDEVWVGFSWRNYTFDHVMRVRSLARSIGAREGADLRILEFAATLHDITKSYDGEILVRDGQRVLDADGFWVNQKLPPARQNRVTLLYERLGLAETVHHYSGSQVATALLRDYGYDEAFCAAVREVILAHLKPRPTSTPTALSLYDADTIDANIGLPAFYRNIRITIHRMEQEYEHRGESFDTFLENGLREFLTEYLGKRIPAWIEGKRKDFLERLTTPTGRMIAAERLARLTEEVTAMTAELAHPDHALACGRLAIIRRFIHNRFNPSLTEEITKLGQHWVQEASATTGARELLARFEAEIAGVC
ncbi:MAG: HD domain-containing protein [Chloroflexi bacterium]|nr:HD domain-containing protein [Chloroflexota bacterium]